MPASRLLVHHEVENAFQATRGAILLAVAGTSGESGAWRDVARAARALAEAAATVVRSLGRGDESARLQEVARELRTVDALDPRGAVWTLRRAVTRCQPPPVSD